MSYVHRIAACASGILLFFAASYVNYTAWVRTGYSYLDVALLSLQMVLFSLAWAWATFRWLSRPPGAILWCLVGIFFSASCVAMFYDFRGYNICEDWLSKTKHRGSFDCSVLLLDPRNYSVLGLVWWWDISPKLIAFISGLAGAAAIILKSDRIAVRQAHA